MKIYEWRKGCTWLPILPTYKIASVPTNDVRVYNPTKHKENGYTTQLKIPKFEVQNETLITQIKQLAFYSVTVTKEHIIRRAESWVTCGKRNLLNLWVYVQDTVMSTATGFQISRKPDAWIARFKFSSTWLIKFDGNVEQIEINTDHPEIIENLGVQVERYSYTRQFKKERLTASSNVFIVI